MKKEAGSLDAAIGLFKRVKLFELHASFRNTFFSDFVETDMKVY